ncbi:hypothetical protein M378DRAFT_166275, partial [Amanita muscaria Koide BX008]
SANNVHEFPPRCWRRPLPVHFSTTGERASDRKHQTWRQTASRPPETQRSLEQISLETLSCHPYQFERSCVNLQINT